MGDCTPSQTGSESFTARMRPKVLQHLAKLIDEPNMDAIYDSLPPNVHLVFARELAKRARSYANDAMNESAPQILKEDVFVKRMLLKGLTATLFHLGRLYDKIHFHICHNRMRRDKDEPHNPGLLDHVVVDVSGLCAVLDRNIASISDEIELKGKAGSNALAAHWKAIPEMSFDELPQIKSLDERLPGETHSIPGNRCAGIAGGGGSDAITISALGRLFPQGHEKERRIMDLVISTRAWLTESQGMKGSDDLGKRRKIRHHGGPAHDVDGRDICGTYRVVAGTSASGRDLEPVLVDYHKDVYMVLDQGDDKGTIAMGERVDLSEQYGAVLHTHNAINPATVFVGDTGGDVFGDGGDFSTPDQDLRAQRAVAQLAVRCANFNPVTVVMAPGADAPPNAPEIASKAGGKRYHLDPQDSQKLLKILVEDYRMDGSEPGRYSRTTLSLIEWLRGKRGWVCLNMPEDVVNTAKNPWETYGYVRECMGDIIFMPLLGLLPMIDPEASSRP